MCILTGRLCPKNDNYTSVTTKVTLLQIIPLRHMICVIYVLISTLLIVNLLINANNNNNNNNNNVSLLKIRKPMCQHFYAQASLCVLAETGQFSALL